MKLKNKIILTLASCLIAVGSIIHFGLAERSLPGDITLADISMMAQADGESGSDCSRTCFDSHCNPVWIAVNCVVVCGTKTCTFTYANRL